MTPNAAADSQCGKLGGLLGMYHTDLDIDALASILDVPRSNVSADSGDPTTRAHQKEMSTPMSTWNDPAPPDPAEGPDPAGAAGAAAAEAAEARGRRLGRPRGPARVPLTVRILAAQDERLTAEVARQGLSPQYLVEQALSEYFTRLDRQRGRTVAKSAS